MPEQITCMIVLMKAKKTHLVITSLFNYQ